MIRIAIKRFLIWLLIAPIIWLRMKLGLRHERMTFAVARTIGLTDRS